MSLSKDFFNRNTNITAKVIADSISEQGVRITTLEVEAPRIILAEINTHNAISKNCSSTRAITLQKAIKQVETNGFVPLYWGEKKAGMSADKEVEDIEYSIAVWNSAKSLMIGQVDILDDESVHKQISGRLLEPFQMVKQVLTATDWDNFFNLRIHPTAQPEILMLAYKIYKAIEESTPHLLKEGDWHLPYINIGWNGRGEIAYFDDDINVIDLDDAIKISASCCAQVSYRNTDMSLEKADKIFNMLIKSDVLHASCFEHLATPNKGSCYVMGVNELFNPNTWQDGITHLNKQHQLCSANFRGWVQYRHTLKGNTCWKFDFEERMTMFE